MSDWIVFLIGILAVAAVCFGRNWIVGGEINVGAYGNAAKNLLVFVGTALFLIPVVFGLFHLYHFNAAFFLYTVLVVILTAIAVVDFSHKIIPDILVAAGVLVGVAGVFLNPDISWFGAVAGMFFAGGVFLLIFLLMKSALGFGDVKLFACLGLCLGVERVMSAMVLSTVLCALTGVVFMVINHSNRKKMLPFAPFILMGTILAIFL